MSDEFSLSTFKDSTAIAGEKKKNQYMTAQGMLFTMQLNSTLNFVEILMLRLVAKETEHEEV